MSLKQNFLFEPLRRFRQKDLAAVEGFSNGVGSSPLDRIGGRSCKYHGLFRLEHFDKLCHIFEIDERADAIVNENMGDGSG